MPNEFASLNQSLICHSNIEWFVLNFPCDFDCKWFPGSVQNYPWHYQKATSHWLEYNTYTVIIFTLQY
ncbi:hypothetical protein AXF35_01025 [Legionella pneumophila subsp. pascullei]|uniref:Uncharacterized protein n=1 Tax=Legionella pneumophila subsp. pascullei TaxID=91890 RepID=A0AAX2ITF8_LEGPN|nr:hypothetical protein AXF35_01025 [Legionella pneumophila subsp. pascullei]AMP91270.1 hypothetical protein AXF36_01025 [Legionella pneumophila subsp. pascullei]AMP94257.1 hypothetical protein AXF37_01025 [Legionella pneumophila subsp. pascullei]SQG89040.1 Uncharacterised protein [Legionella pneumophila subsp. pascullei]VEH04090.1 Uncharacterised protein [Legionella pneumophila subsp. pascullei]